MRLPVTIRVCAATLSAVVLLPSSLPAQDRSAQQTELAPPASAPSKSHARVELQGQAVEVPLLLEDGQPVVEVRIRGQGPFRFWLDTGAGGQGILSSKLQGKLKLEKVGTQALNDPTQQNARQGDVLAVDELSLGAAVFRDLRMVALPPSDKPPPWERKRLDGILGFDLFANVLLTLDYPARMVRLERGELPSDTPGTLPFVEPEGVPRIRVRLGNLELEADVDSGSMGSFGVSTDLGAQVPWATEPSVVGKIRTAFNEGEIRAGRSKEPLRIGAVELPLPEVQVSPLFTGRHANLGSKILRRFRLTFDSVNGRVRFAGPADGSVKEGVRE